MKTINMTGVIRYCSTENQVLTTHSRCLVSESDLLKDLSAALKKQESLEQAIKTMREALGLPNEMD